MPATPDVSVLMPVRNGARYLPAALASLRACRAPALEIVVVDDGSTDTTPAILAEAMRVDARLVALAEKAGGIVAALERARRRARAPLLARLDADDLAYPERFRRQAEAFAADSDLVLLGTAADRIDAAGRIVGALRYPEDGDELRRELARRNPFVHSTTMMRRSAVAQAGGYRAFFLAAEDYDLWLRIAAAGRIGNLGDRLGAHRIHAGSTTARHTFRQAFSAALARASARARSRNQPDPADGLDRPIAIEDEDWPPAFASEVTLYRALAFADGATFARRSPTAGDLALLLDRRLPRLERKLAQAALAAILRNGALPGSASRLRVAAAVIARGALRGARLIIAPSRDAAASPDPGTAA
jgi:GT2 family glycosyltransferase